MEGGRTRRHRRAGRALALLLGGLLAGALLTGCDAGGGSGARGGEVALPALLGPGDAEGFARADGPRELAFPRDHGPHPEYRSEWWYFSGNVATPAGRRLGYQLTFFRSALAPPGSGPASEAPDGPPSAWATRQVYMGHLAVTDAGGAGLRAFERLARGAAGLAGARRDRFHVWIGDWRAEATGTEPLRLRLRAAEEGAALELALEATQPRVLHGERGYHVKDPEAGSASYYYSQVRLRTRGTIALDGRRLPVSGESWLDREWSTSVLGPEQVGWDWLALQLADGSELMLYRLRDADGASAAAGGTYVPASGPPRTLGAAEVVLEPRARWESPDGGARYPLEWRVAVPAEGIDLAIAPLVADQELRLSLRYWEGAVRARGSARGRAVTGRGYMELTGYAERFAPGS